jgi:hypothetical protein
VPPVEHVERPAGLLPFRVDARAAEAAFARLAKASFWRPIDLASADLRLRPLLLPAWAWSARVETHWIALGAPGAAPRTGADTLALDGVLLPASTTLSRAELAAVCPFDAEPLHDAATTDVPYEIGTLTRTAATRAAQAALRTSHDATLRARIAHTWFKSSSLFHDLDGGPLWLPVYVGAWRRGDQVFRVLINGQTGKLVGAAPLSWRRVGCALFAGGAIVAIAAAFVGLAALVYVLGPRFGHPLHR